MFFFIIFDQSGTLSNSRNRPGGKIIDCFILAVWWWVFFFYLEGTQLLLLWGEELLVHLYAMVCTICEGSIICLHWYVRSILRFPLNYSEPRELSYTICTSLHNAQQSSPHFVLLSCKIEAASEAMCEFSGSFSSWSLHLDSRERNQRTGGEKCGVWGSLWDSHLQTSHSQPFSLSWTNWRKRQPRGGLGWVGSMVVSNWTALGQMQRFMV